MKEKKQLTRTLKPGSSKAKTYVITGMIVVLVLAAVVSGIVVWRNTHRGAVNVYPVTDLITYGLMGEQTETDGQIQAKDIQTVFVSETQTVSEILVEEGQTVKKGDPLFKYDSTLTELDIVAADLTIQQKQVDLEKAKKELATVKSYRAGVAIPGSVEWISYGDDSSYDDSSESFTAELHPVSGSGTKADPYVYDWTTVSTYGGGTFDNDTLQQMAQNDTNAFVILRLPVNDAGETDPSESESPADPEESEEPEYSDEEDSGEASVTVTEEETTYSAPRFNAAGPSTILLQIQCVDGSCTCSFLSLSVNGIEAKLNEEMPEPEILEPVQPSSGPSGEYTEGIVYTAAELADMVAEAEQEVRQLELDIREQTITYNKLKDEAENDTVYSTLDGTVVTLNPDASAGGQTPIVKVSANGNYQIQACVGEYDLNSVEIGQGVTVTVYGEESVSCEGTITAIGDYPTSNVSYYYNGGNTNISYYPLTVEVSGEENLSEGDYAEVYLTAGDESASGLFIENTYIRSEGGKYYVYADNGGTLEKRYVQTGMSLYGYYTQVLSGLTEEDYIAFPYGTNVTDGAKTSLADISELWS